MKKFDNIADDSTEKALRRGYVVPDGAVNIAWTKAPQLSPKNNVIIVDTSKTVSANQTGINKTKTVAFADVNGILEDSDGNQIWDEEYPVISDLFLNPDDDNVITDYTDDKILPFLHVSRHFHVDLVGIAYKGSLQEYRNQDKIKIVDKNGNDYVDLNGRKKYKVYLIAPNTYLTTTNAIQSIYRVHVFFDCNPEIDELYLAYDKVQLTNSGIMIDQEFAYKECINPHPYYKYIPEESDVADLAQASQTVFSTKPSNLKDQILGGSQNSVHGWKYFVPRKAIPDPRIFQIFRWRAACEFTRSFSETPDSINPIAGATIRAGVIIPNGGNHLHTYANYFFYQLNESEYNFANLRFVNPLSSPTLAYDRNDQQTASYWHVNIDTVTLSDLSKFDVLIWAPTATTVDFAPYLPKINYFTQTVGGTLIFESGSTTSLYNLPGSVVVSTPLDSMLVTPNGDTAVSVSSLRFYDATADDPNDTFSSFGMWKKWPPNIGDILNTYTDTGSILASASVLAGWDLDSTEQQFVSGYENIPNTRFQFIRSYSSAYRKVFEAQNLASPFDYKPTVIHQKFNTGGNIFVSTCSLYDDHMFEVNGNLATRSLQIPNIGTLDANHQINFQKMVSSFKIKTEMKLRLNTMLLATVYKPSPVQTEGSLSNVGNAQSTIVYGDWTTSWVINPEGGVLSDKDKNDNNFALLPIDANNQDPVWQRILGSQTLGELIQAKVNALDPDGTNPIYNTSAGAQKRYFMLVTNPQVQVKTSDVMDDSTIPTAWTTAYSPRFEVPYHMGTYAVRDEMVAGTGVGTGRRLYPPKPYDLQASVSYYNTATTQGKATATVSLTGSYHQSIKNPDVTQTVGYWIPGTDGYFTDLWMHWNATNGYNSYRPGYQHMGLVSPYSVNPVGFPSSVPGSSILQIPNGVDTWADANYQIERTNNWPFMGRAGHAEVGTRGELVVFVQRILNQLIFFGDITGPYVKEDGYYSQTIANKVYEFQVSRAAQYIDGIVDSETLSLFGFYLISRTRLPGDYLSSVPTMRDDAIRAIQYMNMDAISDDNYQSAYSRISWWNNSPASISQGFYLKFIDSLTVMEIAVLPFLGGTDTNYLVCDWVDVGVNINPTGYQYQYGDPGPMYGLAGADYTTSDNIPLDWIHIYFPERTANSVLLRLRQDGPSGLGSARFLGVRDIGVKAKRFTPGTPAQYSTYTVTIPGDTYSQTSTFSYTSTLEFDAGVTKIISPFTANLNPVPPNQDGSGGGPVYSVRWDNVAPTIAPSDLSTSFSYSYTNVGAAASDTGLSNNQLELVYNGYNNTLSAETFIKGSRIGNGSSNFYTKNTNNVISPFARSYGWVSKEDGVTLICAKDGTPYGFPTALPNQVNYSMHFARFRLDAFNTDQTTFYGFYDINAKEFITNAYGDPEISYYDYIRRGPQNVFIAVMTSYEVDSTYNIPGTTDSINRPFKWAMPVYGITTGMESKIQIMPLSSDLSYDDLWALPVKTGSFSQDVLLRPRSSGSLVNYLKNYQGQTVRAHYDVPESKIAAWSAIYGRPYTDVVGEIPLLLDDYTIQVRQYPILIAQQPTLTPSLADPWFPIFTIQRRNSLTSSWYDVPFTSVADYNIWDGTITLSDRLTSTDPRLVRVSYTSQRKAFMLKHDGTYKLNLNPYVANAGIPINKPIYVYILPEYAMDSTYSVIPESLQTRTVHVTYSPNMFNSSQVDYNPLAVLIGIIYVTDSFDINDLTILDTRKRGGGASAYYEDNNLFGVEKEAESYWDVVPNYPVSYQNGGFVIIQLPAELQDDFTDDDIINTIERNITVGTRYKLEDSDGNDWRRSAVQ